MTHIKKLVQPKPTLIRYITTVSSIELKNCLRIYPDKYTDTSWVVVADTQWNERKINVTLTREARNLISYACMYNTAVKEFIIRNTDGALS